MVEVGDRLDTQMSVCLLCLFFLSYNALCRGVFVPVMGRVDKNCTQVKVLIFLTLWTQVEVKVLK